MNELVILTDRDWFKEPRGWRDAVRCLFGRHKAITQAIADRVLVSRCSCGAIRTGYGPWYESNPFVRRQSTRKGRRP